MPEYLYLLIGAGSVLLFFAVIITGVIVQNTRRKRKWHEGLKDFGSSKGAGIDYSDNRKNNASTSSHDDEGFEGFGDGNFGGGGAGGDW